MDAERKLLARKLFRLRVHEAKGSDYQRLFALVMQYRNIGFVPIRPYGNVGDRKNDGFIPSRGIYYQVHAPENPSSSRAAVLAAAKAAKDFQGLLEHWNSVTPIRAFRFVFNDGYQGCPTPIVDAVATIQRGHAVDASVYLAKDLENEALELADDQLIDVLNAPVPEPGLLPSVDFSVLRDVINHVLGALQPIPSPARLQAPTFDEKIRFNGLTSHVASFLIVGSYQSEAVADFFSKNSTFARQQLRDHLATLYTESRTRLAKVVAQPEELGDLVFFDLLTALAPRHSSATPAQQAAAQQAALIVLAFYFEACDIFEDPHATS